MLRGALVVLRPVTDADIEPLVAIRSTPEVLRWWHGADDPRRHLLEGLADDDVEVFVIEHEGAVAGWINWSEETDPEYRHAGIDVFVDPARHGRGLGTDAVRTLCAHLIDDHGHHRLTIDPAADNAAAIAAYAKVGFRPVGVMRQYERADDGTFHDGLLMDLLADELVR